MTTQQIFVIGSPRSGTSAISWALAQHPKIWTSAESDFLVHLFRKKHLESAYEQAVGRSDGGWLETNDVSFEEFASSVGSGIDSLFRRRSNGAIWLDQTPGHTLLLPTLKVMFPGARFVHIVRDGRAVVRSMLNSGFENLGFQMSWTQDFDEACKAWTVYARTANEFVRANGEIAFEVTNESLREDRGEAIARIFDFLGLDFCEGSVRFLSTERINSSFGPSSCAKARQAEQFALGEWSTWTEDQKSRFDESCGELRRALGYPDRRMTPFSSFIATTTSTR